MAEETRQEDHYHDFALNVLAVKDNNGDVQNSGRQTEINASSRIMVHAYHVGRGGAVYWEF